MRLIIDMQACQTAANANGSIGRFSLDLVEAILKNSCAPHTVWLLLNANFPESISKIKTIFQPKQQIKIFSVPAGIAETANNPELTTAAELIREQAIAELNPDFLLITNLFEGYNDNAVTSVKKLNYTCPTAVIMHDIPPLVNKSIRWYYRKTQALLQADLILTTSMHLKTTLENELSLANTQVVVMDASPDESAKIVLAAAEKFYQPHHELIIPHHKPKLAYISPLPPERSGVSDYSKELLPQLARYYDIELIVEQKQISTPWLTANFTVRDTHWLLNHRDHYDRVLYHFGNSSQHGYMFDLLKAVPGIIVLHDFYLSGILYWLDRRLINPNIFAEAIYESHGYKGLIAAFENYHFAIEHFPCNIEVLQEASAIIVHTNFSIELTRRWYPDCYFENKMHLIPLLRAPHSTRIEKQTACDRLGLPKQAVVICSFGLLASTKLNHRLLEAWLDSFFVHNPMAYLIFVGEVSRPEYGKELLQKIQAAHLSDRIQISGFVDESRYRDYLAASTMAVQLRGQSRGETSAALLDCLNYSIPTIINDANSMSGYPDEVVFKIPAAFENNELTAALQNLYENTTKAKQLAKNAKAYLLTHHHPDPIGQRYHGVIEATYQNKKNQLYQQLIHKLCQHQNCIAKCSSEIATAIAKNNPKIRPKTLFIDISHLIKIKNQDLVQSLLSQLILTSEIRVEPIYFKQNSFHYARTFMLNFLAIKGYCLSDDLVEPNEGDVFMGLDFCADHMLLTEAELVAWRNFGVIIHFLSPTESQFQIMHNTALQDSAKQLLDMIQKEKI